jgi:hypothetical protein
MIWSPVITKHSHQSGARSLLAAGSVAITLLLTTAFASAQSVSFEGQTFVNKGLVGVARVPSNAVDQFGETLGGFGSGMAMDLDSWHKNRDGSYGGTLYMLPDRGWNTQGTVDYRGRLHRFEVTLNPLFAGSTTSQNQLQLHYRSSTLFHRPGGILTTGLDPNAVQPADLVFPGLPISSSNNHISVDDEAVVHVGDGTVWVSDEYGPYVYHYDHDGRLLRVIRPPDAFIPMRRDASNNLVENFSANSPPIGQTYNTGNPVSGRQNNQGFEGLAMSPDRKTLFVLLQSALIQDLNATSSTTIKLTRRNTRLLAYDLRRHEPKLVGEYVVQLPLFQDQTTTTTLLTAAQCEMLALNDHQFLVLARDSSVGEISPKTPGSVYRSVDLIDIAHSTNIAGQFDGVGAAVAPNGVLNSSITPATYQKFLNINDNAQLNRFGLRNGAPADSNDLYEKWESMAVVPVGNREAPHDYFLFIGSDNDFITQDGHMAGQSYQDASGANVDTLVLVYRVTLPTYVQPDSDRFDLADHDRDRNDHDHDRR